MNDDHNDASNDMRHHIETFRQEAEELLADIEETILDLEQSPDDSEALHRLFRAMHTLKGSGSMFGFDEIAAFTHHVETALDHIREGSLSIDKHLIDLILASRDQIKAMLQAADGGPQADMQISARIIADLEQLNRPLSENRETEALPDDSSQKTDFPEAGDEPLERIYRIRFRPDPAIFTSGMDPVILLNELRDLGNCEIVAHTDAVPLLPELNPETCYLYWDISLTTRRDIDAVKDVFIFVEEDSRIDIEVIGEDDPADDAEALPPRLGEILVQRGDATPEAIEQAAADQKRLGEMLVEKGTVSREKVTSALNEQKILKKRKTGRSVESIRVPSGKLDYLINLVGELVITQARLSQVSSMVNEMELAAPVEEVERLTSELRDCVLNIRMVPIGTIFSKFKRLVRDLSDELHKEADLVTEGAETELDKTVIERLNEPLVHLIRNAVDHGIEHPAERQKAGKTGRGRILLTAAHRGANVEITIEDDGAGLDKEVIYEKAVQKGLIPPNADLTEKEIFAGIFAPGLSTAGEISNVSGRGVGMDVVKREIEALRGTIGIDSRKGYGTTITISLPLTLAIIDGLMVDVNGSRFVLPLSTVEECVELKQNQTALSNERNMIQVRGELIPFIRLRDVFGMSGERPPIEQIAIVRTEQFRVGMVVDTIIGDHQTVIKSLGRGYRDAEGISGATILGDGSVALIVDVAGLVECARREEEHFVRSADTTKD
jgi:two-component system chemotaxis sensor kinase CheA